MRLSRYFNDVLKLGGLFPSTNDRIVRGKELGMSKPPVGPSDDLFGSLIPLSGIDLLMADLVQHIVKRRWWTVPLLLGRRVKG